MGAVMPDIVAYYDSFRDRLVADYEGSGGNRRVEYALEFARMALKDRPVILDVGCGIGWSSKVMADDGHHVVGVDISPVLIETARDLFGGGSDFGGSCAFEVSDFADYQAPYPFDAVLMIDVYEHFPRAAHHRVWDRIGQTGCSRIVLALPTPFTQQYAVDHHIPLQPIDETITDDDIRALARGVGGRVAINSIIDVWRPGDYRHVLIDRT